VAGVLGPTTRMMSLAPGATWKSMVEAYDEQIKGLVDGGVDLLMLEGVTDSLNAKAAIAAIDEYFERAKKKRMPVMISAQVAESGRTPSGQSVEAFCVSVKHAKPLAVGVGTSASPGQTKKHFRALGDLSLGWCQVCPSASGMDPESFAAGVSDYAKEGLPNFVGGDGSALPSHIAAVAKKVQGSSPRRLPSLPASPYLQLAGLDACLVTPEEGFQVVGSQCTVMGSAKFKKKIGAYKATNKKKYLEEAMEVCTQQCEAGADILDFNLDSDLVSGQACPANSVMSAFMQMAAAEPKVARLPFMLCSCEWNTIKEGLKCVQGKSIVNGLTLMVGETEFLRIARECQRLGAAIVVLAITDEIEPAESFEDKVRILRRSYELLRTQLDFPPEDIIFDCHVLLMGLPDFAPRASSFISAVAELKRSCPCVSFVGGVNNLSLPFRGLDMLRDALHSVFLYHAIPKGLNLAIARPGALPLYSEIDAETRTLCEELLLNASSDGAHLERFMAFVNFRSNNVACLPVQQPGLSKWAEDEEGNWYRASAVLKEAKENQRTLTQARQDSSPGAQKSFLKTLRCEVACSEEPVKPETGTGLPDPCRVDGFVNKDQLTGTITARGGARPDDVLKYLNAELKKRVCIIASPVQENVDTEDGYKAYFTSGADICGTNTLFSTAYEQSKAAAQLAKGAAAEVTRREAGKPRLVAGVLGPTGTPLSSPGAGATWDEVVAAYTEQVRGLVDGGVDLLAIEMVSDTLNAKAAIYAIDEYFSQAGKDRLPLLIGVSVADGRTQSGQTVEAFLVSVRHAKPLTVGVSGALGKGELKRLSQALAAASLGWCHASVGATGETPDACAAGVLELTSDKLLNFAGSCGATPAHVSAIAARVQAIVPRPLPTLPRSPAMQLAGLEAYAVKQDGGFHMVGQRCNMNGSAKFKGLIDAYKYTKEGNTWEAALEVCTDQCAKGADILDMNFDSELIDSKWAMGKFLRLCATRPSVAKVPFVLSSKDWPVIEEGLRSVQGKCVVNAISLVQGEEEFLRLGRACMRYGAAVVVMTLDAPDSFPSLEEKVGAGQRAYRLLRSKLDFPAEDIILDCNVLPVGEGSSARDFVDAVAELRRTCPSCSLIAGLGSLSLPFRGVAPLREALHSVFLHHAIPKGLNMAILDPGALPPYETIEAQTRKLCDEAVLGESADGGHAARLQAYGSYLAGGAAEALDVGALAAYELPTAITPHGRGTPGVTQPIQCLVQGTGTINSSYFQMFGSKCHTALVFHRDMACLNVKRQVWFSSISAWMGQGGSGPTTGASSIMDGLSLYERWLGWGTTGVAVEWGAIGEIGLRRTIYGSRDVFAQFDLGQKLIPPMDAQYLMRSVCCNTADPYEVIGLAYLDQTWQMTLAGLTSGGGLERKNFADL